MCIYQKETIILQIQIKKKENGYTILKLAIKNIYLNYQHNTDIDIDPSVNTRPHISFNFFSLCIHSLKFRLRIINF
jgi:hypothetical protein